MTRRERRKQLRQLKKQLYNYADELLNLAKERTGLVNELDLLQGVQNVKKGHETTCN